MGKLRHRGQDHTEKLEGTGLGIWWISLCLNQATVCVTFFYFQC